MLEAVRNTMLILVGLTMTFWGCTHSVDSHPNVLLILTDDQGYGDFGFMGNQWVRTPNLDQLAAESVWFDRFYVSPVCAPTRASLLTGRYHLATGVSWVTHRQEVMNKDEYTLAELFKDNGYRTGLFGKWHNGKQYPHDPIGQGFDEFLGFKDGHINNYFDADLIDGLGPSPTKGYLPDVLTDRAIQFMNRKEPFFAMVSYNTPHSPFQVPDTYFDRFNRADLSDKDACIYGMIENLDDNIGRLLKHLELQDLASNTLVVFLTDNGPNGYRYNAGLKGIKSHVDEGGMRVPLLIRYPSHLPPQRVSENVAHIDVLPTLAELADLDLQPQKQIHGKSLVTLINDSGSIDRNLFAHQVIREFDTIPGAVRNGRWLLTIKPSGSALFDLSVDPGQQQDLTADFPDLKVRMINTYQDWFKRVSQEGVNPEPIETGHGIVPMVVFPAQEVMKRNGAKFAGLEGWSNDYLIGFEAGSMISWQTLTVKPSIYDVRLKLAAAPGLNADLVVGQEVRAIKSEANLTKRKVQSPDRVRRGEVYEYDWTDLSIGRIKLDSGLNQLAIRINSSTQLEIKSLNLEFVSYD